MTPSDPLTLGGETARAELRQIGEQLYGPRWQTALARELAVNDRTVRRWLSGERPLSEQVARSIRRLAALCVAARELAELLEPFTPPSGSVQVDAAVAPARAMPQKPG